MFLFNSSSSSSSSSSSGVSSLVDKFNTKNISTVVVGMSYIDFSSKITNKVSHAALLLIDTNAEIPDDKRGEGILVEYGNYSPKMSKEETEKVKKGEVIYRYGDKGGLRYYGAKFEYFLKIFGDIGFIDMDIAPNYQRTFRSFIDTIAPPKANEWIQEKYNAGIIGTCHNCQKFAAEALKLLHPTFIPRNIQKGLKAKGVEKKIDIFSGDIRDALENL